MYLEIVHPEHVFLCSLAVCSHTIESLVTYAGLGRHTSMDDVDDILAWVTLIPTQGANLKVLPTCRREQGNL